MAAPRAAMTKRLTARAVVLSGPPGAGKSTLGPALAARLGRTFVDLDDVIVREAGCTIPEIFAREGEAGFRLREARAFAAQLARGGVIATGGGTLVDRTSRHRALRAAHVLGLCAPIDVLARRVANSDRPLLRGAGDPLASLLAHRRDAYAEVHASVDTSRSLDAALDEAAQAVEMLERAPTLVMPLGARSYRVHVEPLRALGRRVAALAPSGVVLVTDARVAAHLRLPRLRTIARVALPGRGDRDKTLASLAKVWDAALAAGVDRGALVLAVGGGVVTDLAGFAAATLLRGVRAAYAPTTLLAMVDAGVGGKTGIDHPRGKNLIGAFHQPSFVVCDPAALESLSLRTRREGVAEIAKIALVYDAALWRTLSTERDAIGKAHVDALAPLIAPAVQAKIDVVTDDEREAGVRELLNFGHTIGHAIEQAADFRWPHGECVALGMRAELALGVSLGVTPRALADEVNAVLDALALPRALPHGLDPRRVEAALASDKKRREGQVRCVFLTEVGNAVTQPIPKKSLKAIAQQKF